MSATKAGTTLVSKRLLLGFAACLLAACGGGGGGSGGAASLAGYTERFANLQSLQGQLTATPDDALPTGTVNYRGVANFNLSTDTTLTGAIGGLDVNVRFDDNSFTGSVENFINYGEQPIPGSLTISNGVLTGNNGGSLFAIGAEAVANGTINGEALDMTVEGQFLGDAGELLSLNFDDNNSLRGGVGLAAR